MHTLCTGENESQKSLKIFVFIVAIDLAANCTIIATLNARLDVVELAAEKVKEFTNLF